MVTAARCLTYASSPGLAPSLETYTGQWFQFWSKHLVQNPKSKTYTQQWFQPLVQAQVAT